MPRSPGKAALSPNHRVRGHKPRWRWSSCHCSSNHRTRTPRPREYPRRRRRRPCDPPRTSTSLRARARRMRQSLPGRHSPNAKMSNSVGSSATKAVSAAPPTPPAPPTTTTPTRGDLQARAPARGCKRRGAPGACLLGRGGSRRARATPRPICPGRPPRCPLVHPLHRLDLRWVTRGASCTKRPQRARHGATPPRPRSRLCDCTRRWRSGRPPCGGPSLGEWETRLLRMPKQLPTPSQKMGSRCSLRRSSTREPERA
mmetsp:Transcript_12800/g.45332  ORF Transcript_12800/g.45332 Transcript_12800/m.45332 type:complete len:257 (-) Transcript_12800:3-773(-)